MLTISTHVLDTSQGMPASGIFVTLEVWTESSWRIVGRAQTNADGRVSEWGDVSLAEQGVYCLAFQLEGYFSRLNQTIFFPEVRLQFQSDGSLKHLHVPLLLSPFGYSTYRGS